MTQLSLVKLTFKHNVNVLEIFYFDSFKNV